VGTSGGGQGRHQLELVVDAATRLPAATLDHPFGPDADVYKVAGKVFALVTSTGDRRWRVNLKVHPDDGAILRAEHAAITPGWHMDKRHWITVDLDGTVPDGLLGQLVDDSYELVVEGLPRRTRTRLGDPPA
jgi:predicted DNA-binding protein (MmcQ/YjbR family)